MSHLESNKWGAGKTNGNAIPLTNKTFKNVTSIIIPTSMKQNDVFCHMKWSEFKLTII